MTLDYLIIFVKQNDNQMTLPSGLHFEKNVNRMRCHSIVICKTKWQPDTPPSGCLLGLLLLCIRLSISSLFLYIRLFVSSLLLLSGVYTFFLVLFQFYFFRTWLHWTPRKHTYQTNMQTIILFSVFILSLLF